MYLITPPVPQESEYTLLGFQDSKTCIESVCPTSQEDVHLSPLIAGGLTSGSYDSSWSDEWRITSCAYIGRTHVPFHSPLALAFQTLNMLTFCRNEVPNKLKRPVHTVQIAYSHKDISLEACIMHHPNIYLNLISLCVFMCEANIQVLYTHTYIEVNEGNVRCIKQDDQQVSWKRYSGLG